MKRYVFCIKWGTRYSAEYVNRLYRMVRKHSTLEYQFICFTDNANEIQEGVTIFPLPELGVEHPKNVPGKWRKTALWQADLFGLNGVALFIDLDTVIVDNIDCFFKHGNPEDVIVTRNWLKPTKKLGQTTLFRYPVGKNKKVYDDFQSDPQGIADKFQFEQHYVTHQIGNKLQYWPIQWVKHYRCHCLTNNYIKRYFKAANIPPGCKVIAFPGWPDPDLAAKGIWNHGQTKHPTPIQHLYSAFKKSDRVHPKLLSHLKGYQKPCTWINEQWK